MPCPLRSVPPHGQSTHHAARPQVTKVDRTVYIRTLVYARARVPPAYPCPRRNADTSLVNAMLRDLCRTRRTRTIGGQPDRQVCRCKRPRQLRLTTDVLGGLFVQSRGALPHFITSSSVETAQGRNGAIRADDVPYVRYIQGTHERK